MLKLLVIRRKISMDWRTKLTFYITINCDFIPKLYTSLDMKSSIY